MSRFFFASGLILAATQSLATAQLGFDWIWPPPFGLVDSQKSIAPCGGFNGSSDVTTHYLNQLRWNQSAQEITYMTRVAQTLNVTSNSVNWSELYPVVHASMDEENAASSSNQFCIPISRPASIDSDTVVFQLIANTPVGIIFACSRVSFQPASDQSFPTTCNPSIRGNNTVNNITDPSLLSAAALPPGSTATSPPSTSSSTSSQIPTQVTSVPATTGRKHLSGGAIAGTVVGVVVGGLAFLALMLLLFRHRQKRSSKVLASESGTSGSNLANGNGRRPSELPAAVPVELSSDSAKAELPGSEKPFRPELPAEPAQGQTTSSGFPRDEKPPIPSPESSIVSPISSTPRNHPVSPVSPIMARQTHSTIH